MAILGRNGPRPTPTATLKLRGSTLLPLRENEPVGSDGAPTVFAQVVACPRATEFFNRLVEDLRRLGLYAAEDYVAHNHYALAQAEWEAANALVQEGGLITDSPQGRYANPAIKVREGAWDKVAKLSREFGLSPASRVGLQTNQKAKGDATGIEALLKKKTA